MPEWLQNRAFGRPSTRFVRSQLPTAIYPLRAEESQDASGDFPVLTVHAVMCRCFAERGARRDDLLLKMELKWCRMVQNGAKREPNGAKREPKGSQRATQMPPNIDVRTRLPKRGGAQTLRRSILAPFQQQIMEKRPSTKSLKMRCRTSRENDT